jgi:hypothetical protein
MRYINYRKHALCFIESLHTERFINSLNTEQFTPLRRSTKPGGELYQMVMEVDVQTSRVPRDRRL